MFTDGHFLDRQSFLFLLDLEVRRARRYQNYLSILSLTFGPPNPSLEVKPSASLKTVANLLKDEIRDTDIIGRAGEARLLVMLPHADLTGAHKVRERLERMLHDYGFVEKGLSIQIEEACFPTHATNIDDLLQIAGNHVREARP
jgi:diguanylate cyclase (GGDEF)-like protein